MSKRTDEQNFLRLSRAKGFALILSLILVSFLTLLTLGVVAFSRSMIEDQEPIKAELMARQQAKLGMAIAIGQLQKIASQDARAIAPMRTVDPNAPHGWIGVWDTDATLANPQFLETLVSGNGNVTLDQARFYDANPDIDPIADPDDPSIILWEDADIDAPVVTTSSTTSYAYHISDESMKVPVGTGDVGLEELDSPVGDSPFVFQQPGLGAYFQLLNPDVGEDDFYPIDPRQSEDLAFTDRLSDIDYLEYAPASSVADLVYSEQDVTPFSLGVLSRTDGQPGLKEDLSLNPDLLGPGLKKWLDYESYMLHPDPSLPIGKSEDDPRRIFRMQGYSDTNPNDGDFVHVVAPVITDFGIQFSPKNTGNPTTIQMRMVLEMWNPYAQALNLDEMELRIRGIPEFEVIPVDSVAMTEHRDHAFTVNPMKLYSEPVPGEDDAIVVKLDFELTDGKSGISDVAAETKYWPPGRLLYWIGKNNGIASSRKDDGYAVFATRSSRDSRYSVDNVPRHDWPSVNHDRVRYEMPESEVSVDLVLRRDGSLLQRFDSFEFYSVSSDELDLSWETRYLTFQARKMERGNVIDNEDISIWLRDVDPRTVNPSFGFDPLSDSYTTRAGQWPDPLIFPSRLALRHYRPSDGVSASGPVSGVVDERFVFDRAVSETDTDYIGPLHDPVLFDLPVRRPLSLGELQHAYIHGHGIYALGNSWGESVNDIFDTYFVSGQEVSPNPPSSVDDELHPALRGVEQSMVGGTYIPSELLALGRFNLNSVNPNTWSVALSSGMSDEFKYIKPDYNLMNAVDDATFLMASNLPPVIARFPYSTGLLMGMDPRSFVDESQGPPIQFFQQGYRFLAERKPGESDLVKAFESRDLSLADQLGISLVKELNERGEPLYRISEIVKADKTGTSVLERAIQNVPRLRQQVFGPSGALQPVDPLLPAYTLPSDIVTLLAPVASVRGDTFRVKSTGSVRELGSDSEAQMEAVVQRMPTALINDPNQRLFEVISVKWID